MRPSRIQDFSRDVASALRLAVRGGSGRRHRLARLCADKLDERAAKIDDREALFCDFDLAMHFRVAFVELLRATEQRAGDANYMTDFRPMMERFFPEARRVIEGLVLRPLHNSFEWTTHLIQVAKDTVLLANRGRILRQIENGTPPAPKTIDRWTLIGLRYVNRLTERAIQWEWLKVLDDEQPGVKLQTQGMLTEALRASMLMADLRRTRLVFDPHSASLLSDW